MTAKVIAARAAGVYGRVASNVDDLPARYTV